MNDILLEVTGSFVGASKGLCQLTKDHVDNGSGGCLDPLIESHAPFSYPFGHWDPLLESH